VAAAVAVAGWSAGVGSAGWSGGVVLMVEH
jgi:hypothetical protein